MPADASPPPADIAALTGRMSQGDEEAYREFYELYFNRLLRYLLVVSGGRDDNAREALQATLLRVVRHIKPFRAADAFWSWLTVLARSALVDEQRKHDRYHSLLDRFFARAALPIADTGHDADTRLLSLLESGLASLATDERALIERKYFAREPVRAIAAETGVTEKAIESRLVRIRRELKETILAQLNHEQPR
jgi:RNA polymerase sigma-70 factor, ECF subfamily